MFMNTHTLHTIQINKISQHRSRVMLWNKFSFWFCTSTIIWKKAKKKTKQFFSETGASDVISFLLTTEFSWISRSPGEPQVRQSLFIWFTKPPWKITDQTLLCGSSDTSDKREKSRFCLIFLHSCKQEEDRKRTGGTKGERRGFWAFEQVNVSPLCRRRSTEYSNKLFSFSVKFLLEKF